MLQHLSRMGASARAMIVEAAAAEWGVDKSTCRTENGVVYHDASKRSKTYGELASAAAALSVPESAPLKDRKDFRLVGKPTLRVDNHDVVTGKAVEWLAGRLAAPVWPTPARVKALIADLDSDDFATRERATAQLRDNWPATAAALREAAAKSSSVEARRRAGGIIRAMDRAVPPPRELQGLRATLARLVERCHGDDRPDCPILEDLAGEP